MPDDQGPNMELRAFVAVVLSLAVMLGYQYFFAPAPPATPVEDAVAPLEAPGTIDPSEEVPAAAPGPADTPATVTDTAPPPPLEVEAIGERQQRIITIETARYVMQIDNRGGRITSLVLKDYESDFGGPLELVVDVGGRATVGMLDFASPDNPTAARAPNEALYEVTVAGARAPSTVRVDRPIEVRLRWADESGWRVQKSLTVNPAGFLSQVAVSVESPSGVPLFMTLGPGLEVGADTTRTGIYLMRGVVLFDGSAVEHIGEEDIETPEIRALPLAWGGIQSNYFVALFAPGRPVSVLIDAVPEVADGAGEAAERPATGEGRPGTRATLGLLVPPGALVETPLYLGPKDYEELAAAGHALERAVDYGRFRILARPVAVALDWLNDFTGNYGLAIILATFGVRLIFFPLSQSSMKSMRKMQQLQPQMNAIRAKYKGVKDVQKRQEMNSEVMQLYKDNGVSPLGGCLPMLLQMPVLFGFYAAISVSIGIRQAPFGLWIQDLSKMDPFYVLPLLMGASMYVQQRMSPGTGDPVQQRIFRLMPVMFTFFFLTFPSGLVIYWLMNTVLGIGQQVYVNHQLEAPDAKATTTAKKEPKGKKANAGSKGGGAKRRKRGKK